MIEQLALTSSQVVAAIRSGGLSAEAYTRTLIARAEQLEDLNALIALNKDGAIAAARKVDSMRASGAALPPLAGLPIVVKDNINTSDMPTTAGTAALRKGATEGQRPSVAEADRCGRHPDRQSQHARTGAGHHQHKPDIVRRAGEESV